MRRANARRFRRKSRLATPRVPRKCGVAVTNSPPPGERAQACRTRTGEGREGRCPAIRPAFGSSLRLRKEFCRTPSQTARPHAYRVHPRAHGCCREQRFARRAQPHRRSSGGGLLVQRGVPVTNHGRFEAVVCVDRKQSGALLEAILVHRPPRPERKAEAVDLLHTMSVILTLSAPSGTHNALGG